jgi:pimeloyl-ACP methyl ester carboxylesterase
VARVFLWLGALVLLALVLPPLFFALDRELPPELPPAGRHVEVAPGLAVNVLEAGSGPTLVLVHGHPACAYDWEPTLRELAGRGFHVVAYDRVGYGRSDGRAPARVTVETNAGELLALLAALGLRDVTLVGWSYGGATYIVAAKRDPSRIARLVLVGSVGPGIEQGRPKLPEPVLDFLIGPVFAWVASVPPLMQRFLAAGSRNAFHPDPVPGWYQTLLEANFARPHTLAAFGSEGRDLGGEADLDPGPIERPILVIHGDADRLVPLAVGRGLAAQARVAELQVVERGSHMLPVTHPQLLADAIDRFVTR